jgi:hypothetical protein
MELVGEDGEMSDPPGRAHSGAKLSDRVREEAQSRNRKDMDERRRRVEVR